jgi:hypothetical protein
LVRAAPLALASPVTYDITGTVSFGTGIYAGDLFDAVTAVVTQDLAEQGGGLIATNGQGSADFLNIQIFVHGVQIAPQLKSGDGFYEFVSSSQSGGFSSYQATIYDFSNGFSAVTYSVSAPGSGALSATGLLPLSSLGYVGRGDIQVGSDQLEFHVQSIAVAPPAAPAASSVPAPLSLGLLGLGLGLATLVRRRIA